MQIQVHHEWGTLREVVVGFPNVRLPSKLAEAPKKFLPDSSVKYIEKNAGKKLEEVDPKLYEEFVQQINGTIKILKDRGIIVHQVKKHIPSEEAFLAEMNDTIMQTFPRDPMLTASLTRPPDDAPAPQSGPPDPVGAEGTRPIGRAGGCLYTRPIGRSASGGAPGAVSSRPGPPALRALPPDRAAPAA